MESTTICHEQTHVRTIRMGHQNCLKEKTKLNLNQIDTTQQIYGSFTLKRFNVQYVVKLMLGPATINQSNEVIVLGMAWNLIVL